MVVRAERMVPLGTFVALGLAAALGAAWPQAHRDLQAAESLLGAVALVMSATYFAGAAATGRVVARMGMGPAVAVSALVAAACFAAIAFAPDAAVFIAAAALLNCALGVIDAGLNAQVAVHGGLRRLGWLHAVWAIGAAAGPAAVAVSEWAWGSWRPAFALFAIAMVGVAAATGRTRWSPLVGAPATLSEPRAAQRWLVVAGAVLLVATGVEIAYGLWAPTDLSHRGLSPATAAAAAAVYYGGLTSGRIVVAATRALEPRAAAVLVASAALLTAAGLGYWVAPAGLGLVALASAGFAVGPVFPVVNLLTVRRVGATASAGAVGLQMAVGVGGGGALPSLLGAGVQAGGTRVLAPAFAAGALALLLLTLAVRRA